MAVHRIAESGDLEQLCIASGGPWGGIEVDILFMNFLHDLYTKDVFLNFAQKHPSTYITP